MLLWDGGLIKVEICRKGGKSCHSGPIHQFVLDEGELITIGADGGIRVSEEFTFEAFVYTFYLVKFMSLFKGEQRAPKQ